MNMTEVRVGLCGIGLDAYWPQFKALRDRLEGYVRAVGERLQKAGAHVEQLGLPRAGDSQRAEARRRRLSPGNRRAR
jgi:L-arabinose isomerase